MSEERSGMEGKKRLPWLEAGMPETVKLKSHWVMR